MLKFANVRLAEPIGQRDRCELFGLLEYRDAGRISLGE
ncbi:MAG: hypothetical protein ACI9BW_001951 [Gammaproteobacteria bacterium]|jgi:hypothetical protein